MTKTTKERLVMLETKVDDVCRDVGELKSGQIRIEDKLDSAIEKKADKEEFIFWRNLLVSGILLSIALMFISLILGK